MFCPVVAKALEKSEINVYIFRGEGCSFCENAIEFFKEIEDEYGKYYNLVTYEVWNNDANYSLMEKVGKYFDIEVRSVPFIVVGENAYLGFGNDLGETLKKVIFEEYSKVEKERFDVMEIIDSDNLQYEEDENIMAEKIFFKKFFINIFNFIADMFNIWLGGFFCLK